MRLTPEFFQDPYPIYARLRETEPVREIRQPDGLKVWLVTRYEDVRTAFASPALSNDHASAAHLYERHTEGTAADFRADLNSHMLNSDPPDHTRLRKLVNRAFAGRAVARLRGRVEEIATEMVDDLAVKGADGPVDLMEELAYPLPMAVISELLGVPVEDRDKFRDWTFTLAGNSSPEAMAEAEEGIAGYIAGLVMAKMENGGEDILTELVRASEDGNKLSMEEVVSIAFLLLIAGHETTANLIGSGVYSLLRAPDQLEKLRADRSLMPNAIEEFLRFESPLNMATLRFTVAPLTLSGTTIPEGEFVVLALPSANRDPERFPDPDRLDITRNAAGHLAFGFGIHHCVAAMLGRAEAAIVIGALLDKFPKIELAVEPEKVVWRDSILVRGLESLPLRLGA
ncbi:cytochrome P450 family protein [Saccharothrix isguenensis]